MNDHDSQLTFVAHIQQQCMLEARREYEALVEQANMQLAHMQAIIEQLNKDKVELQHLLTSKLHEVEGYKQNVFQKDAEIVQLTTRVNGFDEEASESAKNLGDVIKTNDALLLENDKLKKQAECALNEKDKQISTLLEKHNCLAHKNNKNEEIIASLIKENQHCQCKMKSKGGVKKEGGQDDPSNVDAEQNFALYNLSITGKQYGDHPSLSNDVEPVKCIHIDDEQEAMIGKIIQTTSKITLYCKAKIGNKQCDSTQNLNICLQCSITRCHRHLYECHSKEHTVFMKMPTKKIWCYSCKCDPLSSNGVTSLHKEKSSKKHEKSKPGQQLYNCRGDFSRKSRDHYRSDRRSKSSSQSPTDATAATTRRYMDRTSVASTSQQAPLYHSRDDYHLSTPTNSVHTNTESSLSSTRTTADRQTPSSTGVISSTATYSAANHTTSLSDVFTTENHKFSSNSPATKTLSITAACSSVSTVISDSLPSLSKPIMTKVDVSATVPRIGGKQAVLMNTGTNISDTKTSGSIATDNLKSDIFQTPIIRTPIKCVAITNTTTAIVPVTLHTDVWKNPSISAMSRSETAHNSTSTKSTSALSFESALPTSSNRPSTKSHRRSSSLHIYDNTTTKSTSPDDEAESLQPASSSGPSTTPSCGRSWSLDSRYRLDPSPFKGLVNAGLTCFFNSAVQGLSRINRFNGLLTKLFQPGDRVQVDLKKLDYSLQVTIPAGEHGEVSRRLSKTIANIREPPVYRDQTYFDPSTLFSSIQAKYKNSFRPYRQGDAHEAMRCILDAIRMEEIDKVKRGIKKVYTGSENGDAEDLQNGEHKMLCKAALRAAHKIHTYIDQVIGGEMLSVVVCHDCKHRAELVEPFLDISLPIPDRRTPADSFYYTSRSIMAYTQYPTLEECFKEYTSEDTLDNDNKFICSICSGTGDDIQLRRAMKQLELQTLPEVFIIHLKRFSINHIVTKNSIHVKYPLVINVKPYCTEQSLMDSRQSTLYSLFAVVQHVGTLNFGHYTAYIKMDDTGKWYKADDSLVTEVRETEALHQEAYLLFYHRMLQ